MSDCLFLIVDFCVTHLLSKTYMIGQYIQKIYSLPDIICSVNVFFYIIFKEKNKQHMLMDYCSNKPTFIPNVTHISYMQHRFSRGHTAKPQACKRVDMCN